MLLKIIRGDVPTYCEYPAILLGNRPRQKPAETIQQYFDRTISWLKLRSIIENNGDNLNTKYEMEAKHTSREMKQLNLLNSVKTMCAMYSDSDLESDSDSDTAVRYLNVLGDDDDNDKDLL